MAAMIPLGETINKLKDMKQVCETTRGYL